MRCPVSSRGLSILGEEVRWRHAGCVDEEGVVLVAAPDGIEPEARTQVRASVLAGVPVAAELSAVHLHTRARPAGVGPQDRESVPVEARADAFANTPGKDLLTALRGKDVIIAFVESYGRRGRGSRVCISRRCCARCR